VNMIEAVGTCFRKYFTFRGRARRSEFWYWVLFTILMGIVLSLLDIILFGSRGTDTGPLNGVFSLITLIPGLAVGWRRLHDTNRSGWWIGGFYIFILILAFLLASILVVNGSGEYSGHGNLLSTFLGVGLLVYFIILIVFFCLDSHFGPNRFGDNPKDEGNASVFD